MAKKSGENKSGKSRNSETGKNNNNNGKKSYQPTVDRTTKPPKKNGK